MGVLNKRLIRFARGLQKIGAPSLKNHAGNWSIPVDVGFSLSRILNMRSSEILGLKIGVTDCLSSGVEYVLSAEMQA